MSFWVALDEVTVESGALEFIQGSHLWDIWFQPETFGKTSGHGEYERNPDYVDIPDIETARNEYKILTWDLQPGDVYAFDAMTVHGAGGNLRSDARRRGYPVRYCGDDARYHIREGAPLKPHHETVDEGELLTHERCPKVWPPN